MAVYRRVHSYVRKSKFNREIEAMSQWVREIAAVGISDLRFVVGFQQTLFVLFQRHFAKGHRMDFSNSQEVVNKTLLMQYYITYLLKNW